MKPNKIEAGSKFPEIRALSMDGTTIDLNQRTAGTDWKMVVVYRGKHCPLCTRYLNDLEALKEKLNDINVEIVAVSGDCKAQLAEHMDKLEVEFPLLYGLTVDQMQELGLYSSQPRSAQETDHPFAEPDVFVVNDEGQVQVVDISNNPFVRPDLDRLVSGLAWIKNPDNNYPIRGTYQ